MEDGFLPVPLEVALGQNESENTSKQATQERFYKTYTNGLDRVFQSLREGQIRNKDFIVLHAMLSRMELSSGRTYISASKIAEILGTQPNHIYASIKRLRAAKLIVKTKDKRTGAVSYLFNPYIHSGGTLKQRGFQIKTYLEAISADDPEFDDLNFQDDYDDL